MEPSFPTSNPFSAGAVSDGRLPYFFTCATEEEDLLRALDRHQWIGQIVGPHGSGKTTLTRHLQRQVKDRFPELVQLTIRGPKKIQRRVTGGGSPRLFVVDGVERLSLTDRWLFLGGFSLPWLKERWLQTPTLRRRYSRRRGGVGQGDGLLVTGHRVLPWLATVFETSFDQDSLNRLTDELLPESIRSGIPGGDDGVFSGQQWKDFSRALLQRHGSNGREMLMEMYDRYEETVGEKRLPRKTIPLTKGGVEN